MFVMQHKCPKDSPPKHKGCTTDAPWMYNGSTKDVRWTHNRCCLNALRDAPRIHSHVLRMRQECLTGAPQMHLEHTMGAPGMPHACFTDPPRILFRCTMNALRLSTDVSRAPHRYVFTMDVPWIQYACTAYAEAGSLSLDNLVYLFICLFV